MKAEKLNLLTAKGISLSTQKMSHIFHFFPIPSPTSCSNTSLPCLENGTTVTQHCTFYYVSKCPYSNQDIKAQICTYSAAPQPHVLNCFNAACTFPFCNIMHVTNTLRKKGFILTHGLSI